MTVIIIPPDLSECTSQTCVEDCPVCCRANNIYVQIDDEGDAQVWAEPKQDNNGFRLWSENMDLQELEAIAEKELRKHGLKHWSFGLARTKRRQGVCKFRDRRIEIAEYYARHNSPEKVLDTLLHEIAHALAGPKAGHGPAWKFIAQKLGATPQACDTCVDTVVMPGDWQATCEACNKTIHKYKRPQQLNGYRCRCAARKQLMFQFMGDPSRQPSGPEPIERSAKWEAKCAGCQTVHLRVRKPKAGVWRCRCPNRCEIVWRPRTSGDAQ